MTRTLKGKIYGTIIEQNYLIQYSNYPVADATLKCCPNDKIAKACFSVSSKSIMGKTEGKKKNKLNIYLVLEKRKKKER